jgi:hypothetical protein
MVNLMDEEYLEPIMFLLPVGFLSSVVLFCSKVRRLWMGDCQFRLYGVSSYLLLSFSMCRMSVYICEEYEGSRCDTFRSCVTLVLVIRHPQVMSQLILAVWFLVLNVDGHCSVMID